MNEAKFKAWDKKAKKWIECFLGMDGKPFIDVYGGGFEDLENVEIVFYTGLKDKRGNDIYEGDVVLLNGGMKAQVLYGTPVIDDNEGYSNNQIAGFYLRCIGTSWDRHMDDISTVIGNIHENKDLLKQ